MSLKEDLDMASKSKRSKSALSSPEQTPFYRDEPLVLRRLAFVEYQAYLDLVSQIPVDEVPDSLREEGERLIKKYREAVENRPYTDQEKEVSRNKFDHLSLK